MNIIILLIAISLTVALVFLGLFIWTLRSGQYDDIYGSSARMLFDDEIEKKEKSKNEGAIIYPDDSVSLKKKEIILNIYLK